MNGSSFVLAVFIWLSLLVMAGALVTVAISRDAMWALVLMFSSVWIPLTLRWSWLASKDHK